jgi:hypothetical protein
MALKLRELPEHIKVIAQLDEAIGENITSEIYDNYLTTLDESLLNLKAGIEPTRFVLQLSLEQKAHSKVMDAQMGLDNNKDMQIKLSYMLEEVRVSLINIENGEGILAYKKDKDGYACKKLIGILKDNEIVTQLFNARQNALKNHNSALVSKKN